MIRPIHLKRAQHWHRKSLPRLYLVAGYHIYSDLSIYLLSSKFINKQALTDYFT